MAEFSKTGDGAAVAKFYHSQGVLVEKGKRAIFGREEIAKLYDEYWKKVGPHTFKMSNEKYQGTDDYLIIDSDFESVPEKPADAIKGTFTHIWKKEDGNWLIYHELFEMN
ncbi:hypothetical protein COOONC_12465 [Cooperia oncophora]